VASIDRDQLLHVARLARLGLSDEEQLRLLGELALDVGARVVWDGERYVVIWEETPYFGNGILRASRISREGDSLDGEVTSWRGLELMPVGSPPLGAAMIGRSVVLWFGDRLVMLSSDTLQEEQQLHIDVDSYALLMVGRSDGTGIIAYARPVENALYFRARRVFFRMAAAPVRSRAVRRH